jgi:hypothetical protein
MRNTRLRQIGRLQKSAQPYLGRKHQEDREWNLTVWRAANHAAVLAFLVRYGELRIDEPLSHACERCSESPAWKDWGQEFQLLPEFKPHSMDSVNIIGARLRHFVISEYCGANEKQKLETAFASAPPWLLWFTFSDYPAKLLNLTIPDLSEVSGFMRSKANFDIWSGLPMGAFERKPCHMEVKMSLLHAPI